MKVYEAKLSEFQQLPRNPNKGSERGQYMIEQSVEDNGAARPMLAGKDKVFIAGNHAAEVLHEKLGDEVIVVETDGTKPIIHVRTDVEGDSPRGMEMAIADNRASEVNMTWDDEVMQDFRKAPEIDLERWFLEEELNFDECVFRCPHCGYEWS